MSAGSTQLDVPHLQLWRRLLGYLMTTHSGVWASTSDQYRGHLEALSAISEGITIKGCFVSHACPMDEGIQVWNSFHKAEHFRGWSRSDAEMY